MAITLTTAFTDQLKKEGENEIVTIVEVSLDSGVVKWGTHPVTDTGFTDVKPILEKPSTSIQNKLDQKTGFSTRGVVTLVITGRDNFKTLVRDQYLKNRDVVVKVGFVATGFQYSDYASIYTGKITNLQRKGDTLTITLGDDLKIKGKKKFPVELDGNIQYHDYQNINPVDLLLDLLKVRNSIPAARVDTAKFESERDKWLAGWKFNRVFTKPEPLNKILNELQVETNSAIIHDGEKISFKHFAPPVPGQNVEEWTDFREIYADSISQDFGYDGRFYNRVIVLYDYIEDDSDKYRSFQSILFIENTDSSGSSEWDETKTKTIKSKWIRTLTWTQPTNITGVIIYHVSTDNSAGVGELVFNQANNTLTWEAPGGGGIAGATVTLDKSGVYQIFHTNLNKWIRVVVDVSALPGSNQTDAVTISTLNGDSYAWYLATKTLALFRDPNTSLKFEVDINIASHNSEFIKPTDLKNITTDEACVKGKDSFSSESMMLTSVRPDFESGKISIEARQTKFYLNYGFIAPAGQPDWDSASETEKKYCHIGDASNQLGAGNDEGFVIW